MYKKIGDADMCIAIVNKYTIYPSYPDIDNCCFRNVKQAVELKFYLEEILLMN
jgi:hypothetical protein